MNKGGFSWKRLTGVSRAKSKISRTIGVPLTKSGRQQKLGRLAPGGGCLFWIVLGILVLVFASASLGLGRYIMFESIPGSIAARNSAARREVAQKNQKSRISPLE